MASDPTLDPGLEPWVPVPEGSGFDVQHLPFGVFSTGDRHPRVGVRIGELICDLETLHNDGLLPATLPAGVFAQGSLNDYLALGRELWRATRLRLSELLCDRPDRLDPDRVLVPLAEARLHRPVDPGDYVDFYSSVHHARRVGELFRPDDPLPAAWRHLPIGYHGRTATVVASGTPIRRPRGIVPGENGPAYRPSARLDYELEVGFVAGPGNPFGESIPVDRAWEHVFGVCLVNDWSARDIQAFEYQPLGPFLGKSFATSIAPWLTDLDALAPFMVDPPVQDPPPLPHLRVEGPTALDLDLEVGLEGTVVARTSFREMYWTIPAQVAHATSNGAVVRPGDLFASGTVSGPERGSEGCLLEATRGGAEPITLADGTTRAFLEDGDTVVLRGRAEAEGAAPVTLADCAGTVLGPA